MARLSAASTLSSTTRMRRRADRRGRCRRPPPLAPVVMLVAVAAGRAAGRRTRCPCPGPSLWAVDAPAVHLHQALDQAQADAQPALGAVEAPLGLHEQVEDVRQLLGGDADARVPDPEHRAPPSRPAVSADVAARVGVLGGVVQQVVEDLLQPGRVGVQADRVVGQVDESARARVRSNERPAGLDGLRDDRGQVHRPPCGVRSCPW